MTCKSEKEKMIAGEIYDAYDEELCQLRDRCRKLVTRLNGLDIAEQEERQKLLGKLLGKAGKNSFMLNAQFDYGFNKCSKNSPTSSGGEMNCTSEHICSKKSL